MPWIRKPEDKRRGIDPNKPRLSIDDLAAKVKRCREAKAAGKECKEFKTEGRNDVQSHG